MLAVLHGKLCHGEVVVPVGSDVHEIDIVALAEFLITLLAKIDVGGHQTCIAERLLASFSASLLVVAESNDFYTRDVAEACHGTRTAHAEAYEAYTYGLELRSGEAKCVFLSGRTLRCFHYKCTFIPMSLGRGRQ